MTTKRRINLTVNGKAREGDAEPRTSLADFLRGDLALIGTHIGCEHGVCGACTIMMDGQAVRSCLTLAVQAEGAELMTVEGLLDADHQLHPIQEAFIEEHGLQCGFCTPGFLMSTFELLKNNPTPNDDEIKEALGGNICRCTGYNSIVKSVRLAAVKLQSAGTAS
jgi:aerobic-type carbon monoxide dehydrogenase small subunit (CoxS/CutS family)